MDTSTTELFPVDIEIDRSSPTPLYLQVANGIERALQSGDLAPGARLENEVELAQRLAISRPTVRQGIQELVDKGMLVRKRGVGTQVVKSRVNRSVALTSLFDDLSGAGRKPRTDVLEYRVGRPSAEVAGRLLLESGELVMECVRLRYADGEPLAVMRNTLPERIAPSRSGSCWSGASTPRCGTRACGWPWRMSGSGRPSPMPSTRRCCTSRRVRPC